MADRRCVDEDGAGRRVGLVDEPQRLVAEVGRRWRRRARSRTGRGRGPGSSRTPDGGRCCGTGSSRRRSSRRATRPSTAIRGRYARRISASSDATTAITIPGSTPRSATAANPTIASCASPWSMRQSRRNPRTSTSPIDRGDDDRGERRLRQPVEERRQEEHRRDEQERDEQPGEPRADARAGADRAAREARVDRESLQEAGADVGGAERDELLVGVDLVAALRGERAGGADRLRQRDERESERSARERADLAEADAGNRRRRQALRARRRSRRRREPRGRRRG